MNAKNFTQFARRILLRVALVHFTRKTFEEYTGYGGRQGAHL
jgi:hypothetical protein